MIGIPGIRLLHQEKGVAGKRVKGHIHQPAAERTGGGQPLSATQAVARGT